MIIFSKGKRIYILFLIKVSNNFENRKKINDKAGCLSSIVF